MSTQIDRYEIVAGNGADTVTGSNRDEIIWGDSNNSLDTSANGADRLSGGGGKDEIHGGNGADVISGDGGADTLYGDRGGDTFRYNWRGAGGTDDSAANSLGKWVASTGDWVKDFNAGDGDKLDLGGYNGFLTGAGAPPKLQWSGSGPAAYGVWIGTQADTGTDKIVYADLNGDGLADVAIRVTGNIGDASIAGTNHGPLAGDDRNGVNEDSTISGTVAGNDSDSDGNLLSYVLVDPAPAGLSFNADGSYTFDASSYDSLKAGATEDVVVTYKVSDGQGGSATASLTITITGTNDGPTLDFAIADQPGTEDTAVSFTIPANSFSDVDIGDSMSWSATLGDGSVLPGWLSFDEATRTFSGTPPQDWNGALALTVTVTDGSGATASDSFDLAIAAVNDAPALDGGAAALTEGTEDTAYTVSAADLLAGWSDVDGDTLAVTGLGADHGTVVDNLDGTYTITPDANYNGPVVLSYDVSDGTTSTPASLGFALAAVNDAPALDNPIADQSGSEDEPVSFTIPADTFSDPDGDVLTRTAALGGDAALPGWLSFDAASGTFSGTPPANYNGTISITVTASDGSLSVSDTFDLVIAPVNDAPVVDSPNSGNATTLDIAENMTAVATVQANDIDSATITYSLAAGDDSALFTVDATSGALSFITAPDYENPVGGDNSYAVTVIASDGSLSDSQAFTINVTDVGEAPPWSIPTVYSGNDDPNDFDTMGNNLGGNFSSEASNTSNTWYGAGGNDIYNGGGGNDTIYGGEGDDDIDGNNDQDTLYGGSGNDWLKGSRDNDVIVGGYGADLLVGSSGADKFVYLSTRDTGDTISDFKSIDGDTIDFDAFNYGTSAYLGAVSGGGAVGGGQFGWQQVGDNVVVYADTDGVAGADLVITLTGVVGLQSSDFILG